MCAGYCNRPLGDIPYSDALKGEDNVLEAEFDTQEEVYNSIFQLLDDAIANLEKPSSENLVDIEGDVFYDGDPDAWLMAAHSLKARHLLQLSKPNGNAAYTAALAEVADGFTGNGDNMSCPFAITNQNPLFQFMEQRSGDLVMCSTLLNEMDATSDPRIPEYYAEDGDGGYSGSDPGSENDAVSLPGPYIAGQTASTHLMTYAELMFIEAECLLQTGDAAGAATAYIEAVEASIDQLGVDGETWLDDNIRSEDAGSITLNKIIMQKRHALVGQLQPYNDWRRTGIPSLSLAAGATLTAMPQRFPYSQDEGIYNPDNVPTGITLIMPLWWAE